jgi:hypothetical protein
MTLDRRGLLIGAGAGLIAGPALAAGSKPSSTVWTFDRLDRIGGEVTHVEGAPSVIDTPLGKAVLFDGVDDALFIDRHPLAGAATFTFEALIRPDGGEFAQRWFHLASDEPVPAPATPSNTRFLFELRVAGEQWYLDAFVNGPGYKQTLIFPDKLFPVGRWHHVAQTYDGENYSAYVNGQLQGQAKIAFAPQGPGKASVGVRMNRMNYFKGAIRQARFTPRALKPEMFLKLPAGI